MEKKQKDIGFVFLHGAGLGAWIWDDIISKIDHPCLAVDLPGRGSHADIATTDLSMNQYVESVLLDLNRFSPYKLIIVAHSISGIIGLEVANKMKERTIGFIAISALIPPANESYISSFPFLFRLFFRIMFTLSGTRPPVSAIEKVLCNDLDNKSTTKVIDHFIPESKKLYTDKLQAQCIPDNSLYIRLTKDEAISEVMQARMINNLHAKKVVDIDSGHLPMFNKTNELIHILNFFASKIMFPMMSSVDDLKS